MNKFIFSLLFLLALNSFAGGFTVKNQLQLTQGTTSTLAIAAETYRTYLLILNRGSSDLYVKIGSAHSGTEGVLIPAGGNWEPIPAPIGSVYLKSAAATNNVTVIEGI